MTQLYIPVQNRYHYVKSSGASSHHCHISTSRHSRNYYKLHRCVNILQCIPHPLLHLLVNSMEQRVFENMTVTRLVLWYLCHQQLTIGHYPKPLESAHTCTSYFFKIHFNIILPSTCRSRKWPLSLRFSNHNFVCISHFHVCATCSAHFILYLIAPLIPGEE